jgi:hypothetical protein
LGNKQNGAVKSLVPHINTCLEGLGLIATPEIHGPMARDYVKYNG